jgi:hypothetical protein
MTIFNSTTIELIIRRLVFWGVVFDLFVVVHSVCGIFSPHDFALPLLAKTVKLEISDLVSMDSQQSDAQANRKVQKLTTEPGSPVPGPSMSSSLATTPPPLAASLLPKLEGLTTGQDPALQMAYVVNTSSALSSYSHGCAGADARQPQNLQGAEDSIGNSGTRVCSTSL